MNRMIEGHDSMWPCDFCFCIGYLLSPCTLGLSFLLPNICLKEAKEAFLNDINDANKQYFHPQFHLSLQQRCCISWLQIDVINNEVKENINSNPNQVNNDNTLKLIDNQII